MQKTRMQKGRVCSWAFGGFLGGDSLCKRLPSMVLTFGTNNILASYRKLEEPFSLVGHLRNGKKSQSGDRCSFTTVL